MRLEPYVYTSRYIAHDLRTLHSAYTKTSTLTRHLRGKPYEKPMNALCEAYAMRTL